MLFKSIGKNFLISVIPKLIRYAKAFYMLIAEFFIMAVIGVDVGGHAIKAGIVTKKGTVLDKEVVLTEPEKGRETVVNNIINVIKDLLRIDKNISSIGIGVPGVVTRKGYISYTPNIPLANFDLGKAIRKKIRKKIIFGNDADNFALAKYHFGAGKSYETIVCLTLGTGIGSGIILKGKLFSKDGAPELGHMTIKYDGAKAKCCGNDGCIESYIGRKRFSRSPLEVYKKALAGNKQALKKFENYGKLLGVAISNFVNIFNPDAVILGGQMSNAYNLFRKTMEEEIKKRTIFKTRVVKSKMREAGMIGAAVLAF
ncbi:ROK family protein [Candidatus Woesearchaeota archaeon]|nr:ROK family protein [Candidatus Woesearchaeota archaeon]